MPGVLNKAFDIAILIGIPLSYVGVPAMTIWGWFRWTREKWPHHIVAGFSYAGFGVASASVLLAVCSIAYSLATGGFAYYAPSLMRIFYWGFHISAIAVIFALAGVWRRNPLRWHAVVCSCGMLFFWSYSAMLE